MLNGIPWISAASGPRRLFEGALINFLVLNAALIRGRRLIEGGAYSSKYGTWSQMLKAKTWMANAECWMRKLKCTIPWTWTWNATIAYEKVNILGVQDKNMNVKDEMINNDTKWLERGTKKKAESTMGIGPMTSRTPGGRSIHWATRTHEERGHLTEFLWLRMEKIETDWKWRFWKV